MRKLDQGAGHARWQRNLENSAHGFGVVTMVSLLILQYYFYTREIYFFNFIISFNMIVIILGVSTYYLFMIFIVLILIININIHRLNIIVITFLLFAYKKRTKGAINR